MAVDVSIRFRAESGAAKREINQLQQEIQELRQELGTTQKRADTAGAEVKQLGDQSRQTAQSVDKLAEEAKEAAIGVTSLGRNIFKTSAEAKRFGGVFQSTEGRLREANGEFTQTREAIDRLGDEARESAREVDLLPTLPTRSLTITVNYKDCEPKNGIKFLLDFTMWEGVGQQFTQLEPIAEIEKVLKGDITEALKGIERKL